MFYHIISENVSALTIIPLVHIHNFNKQSLKKVVNWKWWEADTQIILQQNIFEDKATKCGQMDIEQSNKTFSFSEAKLIIYICCQCFKNHNLLYLNMLIVNAAASQNVFPGKMKVKFITE